MMLFWWKFRIFLYFFLLGEGEGGVRGARSGGGSGFFTEDPRGRGFQEKEGLRGREGGIGDFFGGGGAESFFFSGPESPPSI